MAKLPKSEQMVNLADKKNPEITWQTLKEKIMKL
jgi:hypothetical protein